jgi:ABC-2 type transport system ATP-binding protein
MGDPGEVTRPAAYDVRGLVKCYRGSRQPAVAGVDLAVGAGDIVGLLGPNGAGKSTLVRQLVGILRPDSGTISCFGHDLAGRPGEAARFVGYLAQDEKALDELPVQVAVETTGRLRGLSRSAAAAETEALLAELQLGAFGRRPMLRLSGGQRRLVGLAAALIGDRPVLVLDEPTTGLDPAARRLVWAALTRRRDERGTTVVVVTHNAAEAEAILDRVAILDRGRLIALDSPAALKASLGDRVHLDVTWRGDPPADDDVITDLRRRSTVTGAHWAVRLPAGQAQRVLLKLTDPALAGEVDDVRVTTPSLDDVYLAAGVSAGDLERV